MAVSLQVIYPVSDQSRFDFDYYMSTHMKIVDDTMGPHVEQVVITKGLAGGPDQPAAYHAVATIIFGDQDAMDQAMAAAGPAVADIPNFTNVQPDLLIGEVL
ncbi:EthD family reductase [Epibacterium sp. SM1969]|uniref:EthD family reductase n=1 Tax=Tritonibacter aquimaris TaxID=2663379 RepID=A0A844AWP0_9RHOB|nr:EthD family reductase [Tritonibacter aquimaris]MQY42342.1 EthD family reductase [Tritonibacter aquimaris]